MLTTSCGCLAATKFNGHVLESADQDNPRHVAHERFISENFVGMVALRLAEKQTSAQHCEPMSQCVECRVLGLPRLHKELGTLEKLEEESKLIT